MELIDYCCIRDGVSETPAWCSEVTTKLIPQNFLSSGKRQTKHFLSLPLVSLNSKNGWKEAIAVKINLH